MGFLASIFGGGGGDKDEPVAQPLPEPEPEKNNIDPNRDKEISEAAKQRQQILARRGRSSLVTSRDGDTRSGVSIVS
ncbi:MAG: hypothetical protein VW362_12520 [Candidatus Nanopelagicales bacterium]